MKHLIVIFVLLSAAAECSWAQTAQDERLRRVIEVFGLRPPAVAEEPAPRVELGLRLFNEMDISGARDMSCAHCHHPGFGGSDGMMFSIGTGGRGTGFNRQRGAAALARRNSPHLMNLKSRVERQLFWDGRLTYSPLNHIFTTPERGLNGSNPPWSPITQSLSGALAAQTLFPMTDHDEMLGAPGTNELSALPSRLLVWEKIVARLIGTPGTTPTPKQAAYRNLFHAAYPGLKSPGDINIGHVGTALASFISEFFDSRNTPLDQYVRGNRRALTELEKDGMEVFFGTKAICGSCHNGPNLTSNQFFSVGAPEVTWAEKYLPDPGRVVESGREQDTFAFRVPGLRMLALTAPYMHNGSLPNLEAVIDHYNNVPLSLQTYQPLGFYERVYGQRLLVLKTPAHIQLQLQTLRIPVLRTGLGLSDYEKRALLAFLSNPLMDPVYMERMTRYLDYFPR